VAGGEPANSFSSLSVLSQPDLRKLLHHAGSANQLDVAREREGDRQQNRKDPSENTRD
jgi:hypothetical protein